MKQPLLPFRLSFRRHKRVKVSKGQLPLFVEQNFDARALLAGLYNFGTCQRPDGSFYGHGGSQCHKGTEATPESMLAATKTGKVSKSASELASSVTAEGLKSLGTTEKELAAVTTLYDEKVQDQLQRMKDGKVTAAEIDRVMVEHVDFDIAKSEFVFIGMENGMSEGNVVPNSVSAGQTAMARMLAAQEAVDSGDMSLSQAALVNNAAVMQYEIKYGTSGGANTYIGTAADIASVAGGNTSKLSKEQANVDFFGGTKVSTIEMSVPSASHVGFGAVDKSGKPTILKNGDNSMDPGRSVYGALYNGQAGPAGAKYTRNYVQSKFADARSEKVASELKRAAQSDKFRGGMAAPGGGKKYADFQKGVIDTLERGGTPVYTTKVTLTTGGKIDRKTGQPTEIKSKQHTLHVAELSKGKYLVSGDFSLNTPGYGPNRNQSKAYQEGIKAVQTGTATRYKAPAKTSSSSSPRRSAASTTKSTTTKKANNTPTPTRSKKGNEKMELRRKIAKAKREGRDGQAAQMEQTLRGLK